jgi:hypothetical protein
MPGKRFQGHWKDLLAEQRQRENPDTDTQPGAKKVRTRDEAEKLPPAPKAIQPKPGKGSETEAPGEGHPLVPADYAAKLKAAALIGVSPRPQTNGPLAVTSEEPRQGARDAEEDQEPNEPRFPRLHAALLGLHRFRYVSLAVSMATLFLCLVIVYGRDGRPDRVPVSGQVLLDDKPLTCGTIVFVPVGARASTGKLDEQGRFTLTCFDGRDGAVFGTHRVEVAPDGVPAEGEPRWLVPARYSLYETSGLTAEITRPTSDLVFRLKSDDGQSSVNAREDPRRLRPEGKLDPGK